MAADYVVRPMRLGDVSEVEGLTDEGFYDLDVRTHCPGWPDPSRRTATESARARSRTHHMLEHDPGGCWVAEGKAGIVGAAQSVKRDLTWILATFVVRQDLQGRGVGKRLLDASLTYAGGCLRGLLAASADPKAARRYRLAGFTMHPTILLTGMVGRDALPVVDRVREGSAGDIDLMNSVDRQVRDSAHGVDHEILASTYPLVVIDRTTGSGYAYVGPDGGPHLLAATNRRTATDLLWEAMAASTPDRPCTISYLSPQNEWAVDVAMAARLDMQSTGYLALRGMKPPMPYIPSPHFL